MKRLIFLFVFILTVSDSQEFLGIEPVEKLINFVYMLSELLLGARPDINSDADLSIEEYFSKYHYPLEKHSVTTEDGYVLTLHRIPHGRKENVTISSRSNKKSKPIALLKHPFLCSAMDYIYIGPEKSLALNLADLGYDVWLPNTRGNRYSMHHIKFNSKYNSPEFWNFSFHEKGYYDLPASIDYILNTTKRNNLTFIGHSQGATEGLILTSTRPEYNTKFNLMVLLAPITYMVKIQTPILMVPFLFRTEIGLITRFLRIYGVPYIKLIGDLVKRYCNDASPVQWLCIHFTQLCGGFHYSQFNKTILTAIGANAPSGNSIKELIHYKQLIESGDFNQFDYGIANELQYNTPTPPSYNLSKVTVPIATYYGKNDFVVDPTVVERMMNELPNVIVSHLNDFNHVDFLFAIDVKPLLYDKIINLMEMYNSV